MELGFPGDVVVKNLPASTGDAGEAVLIPGSGRSPGVGNGNLFQYSCLGNSMDRSLVGYNSWGRKQLDMMEWLMTIYLAAPDLRCDMQDL